MKIKRSLEFPDSSRNVVREALQSRMRIFSGIFPKGEGGLTKNQKFPWEIFDGGGGEEEEIIKNFPMSILIIFN